MKHSSPTPTSPTPTKHPLQPRPQYRRWDPDTFIYADRPLVAENLVLGAAVINLATHITFHVKVKSQSERRSINRAELFAIKVDLHETLDNSIIQILKDSSFCINTLRNYATDPLTYTNHIHKDLIHATEKIIRHRDGKGWTTHIGKVNTHTHISYNEEANATARAVVDGTLQPNNVFEDVAPPVRGLRT